ncbi:MAG: hypothetical protein ACFCGT_04460 [Sandaracinaceae bacterium]
MPRLRLATWTLLASLAPGCGPPPPGDAGVARDGGAAERPRLPAPPRIPWLEAGEPQLAAPSIPWLEAGIPPIAWTCEGGWRPVERAGAATCEPYGPDGPDACADGEAHFPGEPRCRPIGRSCGDGPFADASDLPDGVMRIYALASAEPGGDGTEGAPLRTLAEALDLARDGTVVLLGSGAYEIDRAWPDGVSLRGRCVAETSLVAPAGSERSAIVDIGRHDRPVRLESVRVGPGDVVGIRVRRRGETVVLDGVEVREVRGDPAGLVVTSGARVDAASLVVRDTRGLGAARLGGWGVSVQALGRLDLAKAVLRANREVGLFVFDAGSALVGTDVRVVGTLGRSEAGTGGFGARVELGGLVDLTRALVDGNRDVGILGTGDGARLQATQLIVRDTLPQESDGNFGRGLSVEGMARLEATEALIEGSHENGVFAGTGGEAVLTEVVVRDTASIARGSRAGTAGRGLSAERGARVELRSALLLNNREAGLFAASEGTEVTAHDLAVRQTRGRERDGVGGNGVQVQDSAGIVLERALLDGNRSVALSGLCDGCVGTRLAVDDLVIRDTRLEEGAGSIGAGISIAEGTHLELRRALVERNAFRGIALRGDGATATLEDVRVRDTTGTAVGAAGIAVEVGADLRALDRAVLEGNTYFGLIVADGSAGVRDLAVRGTRPLVLGDATPSGGGGVGVGVESGGQLSLARALVERSVTAGVSVSGAETATVVEDLVVRDTLPQAGTSSNAVPGELGRGLAVEAGAELDLHRALVERNREAGVLFSLPGTVARVEDLHVRGTLPQELDGRLGLGLSAQGGPEVSLGRVLIEDCRTIGMQLALDVRAHVTDLAVRRTGPRESDGAWGRGLTIAAGTDLTLRHARLEGNRELGIGAFGAGTVATLDDVVVEGTGEPACLPACSSRPSGVSLGAYVGAAVTVTSFRLEGGASCGIQLIEDARIELRDGEVREHPIGICLEEDYPVALLRRNVAYRDNGTLLERSTFVVPDPGEVVGGLRP